MSKKIYVYGKFNDSMGKEEDEHLLFEEAELDIAIDKMKEFIKAGLKIYQFTVFIEEEDSK